MILAHPTSTPRTHAHLGGRLSFLETQRTRIVPFTTYPTMEDLPSPPPYAEHEASRQSRPFSSVPPPFPIKQVFTNCPKGRWPVSSLGLTAIHSYPHTLLVSVTNAIDGPSTTTFHHWTAQFAPASIYIYTQLDIDSLKYVRDFRELGTFTLPIATYADIHKHLTSMITESSEILSELEVIPYILAKLTGSPTHQGLPVRLFSIPVFSDNPEALLINGQIPVWNWTKPTSPYSQKAGLWEVEIKKAILDGEWSAGKELTILVKGVSEDEAEDLRMGKRTIMI